MNELLSPSRSFIRAISLQQVIADHEQREIPFLFMVRNKVQRYDVSPQINLPGTIDNQLFNEIAKQHLSDLQSSLDITSNSDDIIATIEHRAASEIAKLYRDAIIKKQQAIAMIKSAFPEQ